MGRRGGLREVGGRVYKLAFSTLYALAPLHALCSHAGPTPPEGPRNSHLYQVQRTLFLLLLPPSLATLPPVYHPLTHDCTIILHTQQAVCITVLRCLRRWEGLILQ